MLGVGRLVDHDLHRDALHDLDVVAGGVLRRQQAEARPGAGLDAVHVPFEQLVGVGVHPDRGRLPGLHIAELSLLEVRDHPYLAGHDGEERLAHLHVGSRLHALPRDPPGLRRVDLRVGQIELCLAHRRLVLRDLSGRLGRLGAAVGHLLRSRLGAGQSSFRFFPLGLRLAEGIARALLGLARRHEVGCRRQVGGHRVVSLLPGHSPVLQELLITPCVGCRPRGLGLRRLHPRSGLLELAPRALNLPPGGLDPRVSLVDTRAGRRAHHLDVDGRAQVLGHGRGQIRLGLGQPRVEIARV